MDRESLIKLINFIDELSQLRGNEWFKVELSKKLLSKKPLEFSSSQLDEIYEFCLNKIIKEHAVKFYFDFKLLNIKEKLIDDFIRMEKFRRNNEFEDFCLAAYQQIESIVNELIGNKELSNFIFRNRDLPAISRYNKENKSFQRTGDPKLANLIFKTRDPNKVHDYMRNPIEKWFFNHKFRTVLYFYYFNKEIKVNSDLFERVYDIGSYLYQGRNLNHRGGGQNEFQQQMLDDLLPNQHKFYFKFLGFLEDFVTTVNRHIDG